MSLNPPRSEPSDINLTGPRGALTHYCGHCSKASSRLLRCAACHVVRYCSRDHQGAHRSQHKSFCTKVRKCRTKLEKEEYAVRNARPDFMTPANAFEESVGHFWGIHNTRAYMRQRLVLADTVRKHGTLDGISEGSDHLRDMLRLCRSDNLGVRDLLSPLMLQLDLDQECYDFLKWYATEGERPDYDWGDMDEPFLDVKNARVLEEIQYLSHEWAHLPHVAAVLLLKLKILVDIINIRLTRSIISKRLPPELWSSVESHVVRSPLSREWAGQRIDLLHDLDRKLQRHVQLLSRTIQDTNDHFFPALLEAEEHLSHRPDYYSQGTFEEVLVFLQYSYPAWWQHEGVMELLENARSIARKDSKDEIEDMMKSKTFATNPGSDRTKEELLDDVSRNRLWGYLDYAVEDAMSLEAKRPSDVMIAKNKAEWDAAVAEEEDDEYYSSE